MNIATGFGAVWIPLDWLAKLLVIGSLLSVSVAGATRWRRTRSPAAPVVWLYALLALSWLAGQLAWRRGWLNFLDERFLSRTLSYGLFFLGVLFFFLTRRVLRKPAWEWFWSILALLLLVGLFLLDTNLLALPDVLWSSGGRYLPRLAAVEIGFALSWGIYLAGALVYTLAAYWRAEPPFYRNLPSYWLVVFLLTLSGEGLYFLNLPLPGSFFLLLSLLLSIYVVSARHLPEARRTALQLLISLIITTITVVVYGLVYVLVSAGFSSALKIPYPLLASGLMMGLLLAFFFNPLLAFTEKQVERLLPGRLDASRILRQYSQSITNVLDLKLLANQAMNTLKDGLHIDRGFFFQVDLEKGPDGENRYQLRGVPGGGGEDPEMGLLQEENPLAACLRDERRPVTQLEVDSQPNFRDMSPAERDWLGSLKTSIYVPVYSKGEWIGLIALGPQVTGESDWGQYLDLLSMLADQTAVAFENVRLVEGLMRLNNDFRRAYEALDKANRQLERLDQTKTDFISIASHELRTPLTLLSGSSQMLLDDPDLRKNPYYLQLLTKIQSGAKRMHEVIESMLDMAKIDTRDLHLDTRPISLQDMIRSILQDLRPAYEERHQTVEIYDLNFLPAIEADMDALRKVFHHLVVNAIKFTPDGGKISVLARSLAPGQQGFEDGGVEIILHDTGIGIDPRYQELIFRKFYQTGELALHSSGKTKFKGNGPGLGLSIARGIVEAHGGKIWVESPGYDEKLCPGSDFHVILPIRNPNQE